MHWVYFNSAKYMQIKKKKNTTQLSTLIAIFHVESAKQQRVMANL